MIPALRHAALATALVLSLTACGANVAPTPEAKGSGPVTLTNCGRQVTYDKVPERVVTNDVGITEIMFALGLEDRMAGFVMPDDKGDLTGVPWKTGYDKVTWLSKDRITKEIVLDARADMVFAGWNYGFGEDNGLTPDALRKAGIGSYVLTESCRNGRDKARGIMPPLEALYTDLTNLGKLFGVEERAQKLIADFRRQVGAIEEKAPKGAERPTVFLYDSGRHHHQGRRRSRHERPEGLVDDGGLGNRRPARPRRDRRQRLRRHHRGTEEELPALLPAARPRVGDQAPAHRRTRLRRPGGKPPQPRRHRVTRRVPPVGDASLRPMVRAPGFLVVRRPGRSGRSTGPGRGRAGP
jgi:iron complex transport system substrate-binding protein